MLEPTAKRTHDAAQCLKPSEQEVIVNGWVMNYRDHGDLTFIDLRDRTGLVQVVLDPSQNPEGHRLAKSLRHEDVISAKGKLIPRGEDRVNPRLLTGEVELLCDTLVLLNRSLTPPFEIDENDAKEEVRLRYRYLDIRRPAMFDNMRKRSDIIHVIRQCMHEEGFLDIETPLLIKSTPEGARDFLVPSRHTGGAFYALPQSPQIFKQLLVIGGVEKYYQMARCFRDEDLRADRQPEFTQWDLECSFVTSDDIMNLVDRVLARVLSEIYARDVVLPIPRMSYRDAMDKYGSDRPDLRFGMEIVDVTDLVSRSDFSVFTAVTQVGGMVKCLPVPNGEVLSRKDLDQLIQFVGHYGAKGMAWMRVKNAQLESNIVKYFSEALQNDLIQATQAQEGYTLLFIADKQAKVVYDAIGHLRLEVGDRLGLRDPSVMAFTWVVDFPLFEQDERGKWTSVHHPFTAPKREDLDNLESNPAQVLSDSYDIVLNGVELGGGSIRIHTSEVQSQVFHLLGIHEEEASDKFGFLLEALKYGAPPHGGVALGLDRVVMMFQGLDSIRDVIAFPKTQHGSCLLTKSPSPVSPEQLKELSLKTIHK